MDNCSTLALVEFARLPALGKMDDIAMLTWRKGIHERGVSALPPPDYPHAFCASGMSAPPRWLVSLILDTMRHASKAKFPLIFSMVL